MEAYFKIYDYVYDHIATEKFAPPFDIDYRAQKHLKVRLFNKPTIIKGELLKMEYYAGYDEPSDIYSNLILEVIVTYNRTGALLHDRNKEWWYYKTDGAKELIKSNNKPYNTIEQRMEGVRRRSTCIANMEMSVIGLLIIHAAYTEEQAIDAGRDLNQTYRTERQEYLDDDRADFKDAITNDATYGWLDTDIGGGTTIRDYCVDQLTFP